MNKNKLRLGNMVAIAICLVGTIMFSGCEILYVLCGPKKEVIIPEVIIPEVVVPTSVYTHSSSGSQAGVVSGENIVVNVTGTGGLTLTGTCNFAQISLQSAGRFIGSNLEIREAEVTHSGSGSIYVWVTDILKVNVRGSGSVYYKGNPQIISNVQGSGRLIKQ
jgi:hypothetical protein